MPKLRDIYWKIFISELFSLCIENLPNCHPVRFSLSIQHPLGVCWSFEEHLSHALPTEDFFNLLRSIRSESLSDYYSPKLLLDTLEIIIKWLQVSVSERNRQTPLIKNPICD